MKFSTFALTALCVGLQPVLGFNSFANQMGGGAAPVKKASYAPGGGKPYAPTSGSGMGNYLDNVAPPSNGHAAPAPPASSADSAPTATSYLNQMGGGGAAPAKKASYAPGGRKPYAPTSGSGMSSYLNNVSPAAPVSNPAPTSTSYLNQGGGGGAAPVKKASYAPGGGKPYAPSSGSGMSSYLNNVAAAVPSSPVTPASSFHPTGVGGAAPAKKASFAPGGGKPYAPTAGSGMSSYLNNVGAAVPAAPVTPATYFHPTGVGGAAPVKKASYAPGGGKPYAPTSGSGMASYLTNVAIGAPEPPPAYSVPQPANGAPTHASSGPSTSYSPTKNKFAPSRGSGMGGYLGNL